MRRTLLPLLLGGVLSTLVFADRAASDIRDGTGKDLEPGDYGVEFHQHATSRMQSRSVAGDALPVGDPKAHLRVALVIGSPVSAEGKVLHHPEDASAPSRSRILVRDRFELQDRFAVLVSVSQPAYVYLVEFGTSGGVGEVWPTDEMAATAGLQQPGTILKLDGTAEDYWYFTGDEGTERFLAIATSVDIRAKLLEILGREAFQAQGKDAEQLGRMQDLRNELNEYCFEKQINLAFADRTGFVGTVADAAAASPSAATPKSKGLALCIGIDKYADSGSGKFSDLSCAVNDATRIHDKLVSHLGIAPEDARLITNGDATLANIREGLEWLRTSAAGKRAFFYFSGHGVQAPDPQGRDNHFHSALMPHDFQMEAYRKGQSSNLLFDVEMGKWIDTLDCANLVMIVDSCHSGAVTKSLGGNETLRPRGVFLPPPEVSKSVMFSTDGRRLTIHTARPGAFIMLAAQFEERAFEDPDARQGLMTSQIVKYMDRNLTGREIFEKARDFVKTRAARGGVQQVPELVDNTGDYGFRPFE